jgi:hypothetical protein
MQAGVPQALRRAALARIWSLDPAIRDFREMADYDWDFNVPGGAPGYGPLEATPEQLEQWLARIIPPEPKKQEVASLEVDTPTPAPPPCPWEGSQPYQGQGGGAGASEQLAASPAPESATLRPRRHGSAIPI